MLEQPLSAKIDGRMDSKILHILRLSMQIAAIQVPQLNNTLITLRVPSVLHKKIVLGALHLITLCG